MDQQEVNKLLEELLHHVQAIRAIQVQFLAESNRAPEHKISFRTRADTAWKQYNAIHQQLTEIFKQAEAAQRE
jgi:hypothetical protein